MSEVERDPRVLLLVGRTGFVPKLEQMLDQLTRCQKSLNEFLEEKRSQFPRFYFIGDDDLLEILGQATEPTVIQTHLKKLFAGIHKVGFDSSKKTVVNMRSQSGEVVTLVTPVAISINVEEWLGRLSDAMRASLEKSLIDCLACSDADRDPNMFPSQILCLTEQVRGRSQAWWCWSRGLERIVQLSGGWFIALE